MHSSQVIGQLAQEILDLRRKHRYLMKQYQTLLLAQQPFKVGDRVKRCQGGQCLNTLYEIAEIGVRSQDYPEELPQVEIKLAWPKGGKLWFQNFHPNELLLPQDVPLRDEVN